MKRHNTIDIVAHDSVLVITGSITFQYMVAEIAAKVAPEAELHMNSEGLYIDPQTDEFDIDGFVESILTDQLLVNEVEVTNLLPLIYPVCIDWYGW